LPSQAASSNDAAAITPPIAHAGIVLPTEPVYRGRGEDGPARVLAAIARFVTANS
jgi:hypothetical protein